MSAQSLRHSRQPGRGGLVHRLDVAIGDGGAVQQAHHGLVRRERRCACRNRSQASTSRSAAPRCQTSKATDLVWPQASAACETRLVDALGRRDRQVVPHDAGHGLLGAAPARSRDVTHARAEEQVPDHRRIGEPGHDQATALMPSTMPSSQSSSFPSRRTIFTDEASGSFWMSRREPAIEVGPCDAPRACAGSPSAARNRSGNSTSWTRESAGSRSCKTDANAIGRAWRARPSPGRDCS